jgi:pyruvate kinase
MVGIVRPAWVSSRLKYCNKQAFWEERGVAGSRPEDAALQIVATLGPSSLDLSAQLWRAGATAFRLNASHFDINELAGIAAAVRRELPEIPLVVDLQGAKMRLGVFPECAISRGDRVRFSLGAAKQTIPIPHRELFSAVEAGDTLSCDDGRLRLRVEAVAGEIIDAVALSAGPLLPRKGVNVLEHPVALADLTATDQACITATRHLGRTAYAFSFIKDGPEAAWIRRREPHCTVAGKIERREAVENIDRIARAVDALWICRGDLMAQMGAAAMARWVSGCNPRLVPCPVLMAGQVLEHLTFHAEPTRSEVCHLHDLVGRGYAGFVLSDETAIGRDPAGAVRALRSLLDAFRDEEASS